MINPYWENNYGKLYLGDTLEILKTFDNESVDCVMTSPPYYGLRNYGVDGQIGLEETFDDFLIKILNITAEIKRVLKKTGSFWLNMGDCYGGSGMGRNGDGSPGKCESKIQKGNIGSITGKRLINWGGNVEKSTLTNPERQQEMGRSGNQKCMLMQPERLAIKMIDEQGWILRNKIKWCKQIYIHRDKKTIGSVMPTSVKDRFNESGEELYFFVKNKKYYFDLDAVRLPNQVLGITDFREDTHHPGSGFVRTPELYQNSKYRGKFRGNENVEDFNSPRARTQRKNLDERLNDTKNKDTKSSRTANIKKLLSEVRLGIKPNTGMMPERFDDEYWMSFLLGTSHSNRHYKRGFEMMKNWMQENQCYDYEKFYQWVCEYQKGKWSSGTLEGGQCKKWEGAFPFPKPESRNLGKNLPTIWQIGIEPHNFKKELDLNTEHFAAYPQALCEIPIKASCPEKGIILDPFVGSGTTVIAAQKLNRQFMGIDINEKYLEISKNRLRQEPMF